MVESMKQTVVASYSTQDDANEASKIVQMQG